MGMPGWGVRSDIPTTCQTPFQANFNLRASVCLYLARLASLSVYASAKRWLSGLPPLLRLCRALTLRARLRVWRGKVSGSGINQNDSKGRVTCLKEENNNLQGDTVATTRRKANLNFKSHSILSSRLKRGESKKEVAVAVILIMECGFAAGESAVSPLCVG